VPCLKCTRCREVRASYFKSSESRRGIEANKKCVYVLLLAAIEKSLDPDEERIPLAT
jgi:hypothetical protein